MKFPSDEALQEKVRKAKGGMDAAKMGRDKKNPRREDWEEIKDEVMYKALEAKFTQHEDLKAKLLETKGYMLVEHTVNDVYWADGGDGSGKNMLGQLLVRLRS